MIAAMTAMLLGAQSAALPPDRTCQITAVQLGAIVPEANSPPNWYTLAAVATTDSQNVEREVNIKAVVTYTYVNVDGETAQGESVVALKGDGAVGDPAVALIGRFSVPTSHGPLGNAKADTSLCLVGM